jgi:sugar O-acyltransferase (sialic acid O-acetyltransferase NeuD family)
MENPVIIIGANAIGREAMEIFERNGNVVYGFLDDDSKLHGSLIQEVAVLGSAEEEKYLSLLGKKCEVFIALDDNRLRKTLVKTLNEKRQVQPVNAVHASAQVSASASLGHGTFVGACAVVGPGAELGHHCLIHAGALVGTLCKVGDFVQIGQGVRINPGVVLEQECFIGTGAVIVSGVTVGKGARIGAGSVVISSVPAGQTMFGNPAVPVKP